MFESLQRIWNHQELKQRILFTLLMLFICRIGAFIPVPGIDSDIAMSFFKSATGGSQNLFQMVNAFTGGAFSQMTVIALGVVPYISASIIMQLLLALMPGLQREIRDNQTVGKRKLTRYSRYLTLALSFVQSAMFARYALGMNAARPGIISGALIQYQLFGFPLLFYILMIVTMTTGTLFLMWIGEQITEKGIGNGMSMIITLNILSQLPSAMGFIMQQLNLLSQEAGTMNFATIGIILAIFACVTIGTIQVIQGQRRIPLQHARRIIGRKESQGGTSYLPLKVNYAGVIPVIFASSLLMFPATLGQFIGSGTWLESISNSISQGGLFYYPFYIALILFFSYFWTAMQFRPDQIASDMKKNGAFIPGIRQGKPTQDYLEGTMNRLTLIGAVFLALIAILPDMIGTLLSIPRTISYFFGGTALLILVGVVLDTMKQIESHLISKRYSGFMRKGRERSK